MKQSDGSVSIDVSNLGTAVALYVKSEGAITVTLNGEDIAVLVIECRETNEAKRNNLVNRLQAEIRTELGIDCFIELVPRNTLPKTTSGKLSRSGARKDFLKRVADGQTQDPFSPVHAETLMKKAV